MEQIFEIFILIFLAISLNFKVTPISGTTVSIVLLFIYVITSENGSGAIYIQNVNGGHDRIA